MKSILLFALLFLYVNCVTYSSVFLSVTTQLNSLSCTGTSDYVSYTSQTTLVLDINHKEIYVVLMESCTAKHVITLTQVTFAFHYP